MPAVLLYAEETSLTALTAPRTADIRAALARVSTDGMSALAQQNLGGWVGPARITREYQVSVAPLPPKNITRVSVLWQWPDTIVGQEIAPRIAGWAADRAQTELQRLSSDFTSVALKDYNARLNGPLTWWANGSAAREARYVDSWPTLGPGDNPIGPNLPTVELTQRVVDTMRRAATDPNLLLGGAGLLFPNLGTEVGKAAAPWLVKGALIAAGGLVLYLAIKRA